MAPQRQSIGLMPVGRPGRFCQRSRQQVVSYSTGEVNHSSGLQQV
jgi:hypothetical protein